MTSQSFPLRRVVACWPYAGLILSIGLILNGLVHWSWTENAQAALPTSTASARSRVAYAKIEDIRVGMRVITDPRGGVTDLDGRDFDALPEGKTNIAPSNWRLIRMRAEETWPDGTVDDINIETLQPEDWIEVLELRVGDDAPIPLDLVEMGLREDLRAEVLAIEPCPDIEQNPGRVVVTTVNHLNSAVLELTLVDGSSKPIALRPTAYHKFYRVSDKAWISAQDLKIGDTLQGQRSLATVTATQSIPGIHRVYNFTVEGEHVYRVSPLGVLVHNTGCSVVEIIEGSALKKIASVGADEAVDVVKMGGDVMAPSRKVAEDIARRAGSGPPVFDRPHGPVPPHRPHYHPIDAHGHRLPGHIFF